MSPTAIERLKRLYIIIWLLVIIGQIVIAIAIVNTSNNTAEILKLLKNEIGVQKYKDWKKTNPDSN